MNLIWFGMVWAGAGIRTKTGKVNSRERWKIWRYKYTKMIKLGPKFSCYYFGGGGCSTKESGGCSISHVPHFIFLKDIKFLSSTPMIPWHQKKITIHKIWHIFWVTEWFAVFKTFPFHFTWFFGWQLHGSHHDHWIAEGFHHVPGALVQSFSTFGSFIEGGDMEDRLVFRLKALERCQGAPKKKGLFFCFCKSCISLKVYSVSFKEDVSGKWVMRLEKECQNSYPLPYLPVLNCKWTRDKKPTMFAN